MGRTITPTYRIEMRVRGWLYSPAAWDCKRDGRPTDETLEAHVKAFEASTEPGGVNAHLGATKVRKATVIRQSTDETVATYEAPSFATLVGTVQIGGAR